ncbi:MAG: rRNA maturation RNase YbeY [Chloroflexi bacterium]|nr:rRNA maturation RNase YbeY [Chloroflexota bacterium]
MTQIAISIQNEADYPADPARLRAAAQAVLAHQQITVGALTIVIADDAAVAALNQQFRGIDAPTDVLSFPADAPPVPLPDEPPYLGDLVIAHPYTAAQAAAAGHDLHESLALLVVHGTLHLLGYDHGDDAQRAAMWAAQAAILRVLHIDPAIVPDLELDDSAAEDSDTAAGGAALPESLERSVNRSRQSANGSGGAHDH